MTKEIWFDTTGTRTLVSLIRQLAFKAISFEDMFEEMGNQMYLFAEHSSVLHLY